MSVNVSIFRSCLVLIIMLGMGLSVAAQVKAPVYGRGQRSLDSLMLKNLDKKAFYDTLSQRGGFRGAISFVVRGNGQLDSIEIVGKEYPPFMKEVARVIRMTNGQWRPAEVNGRPADRKRVYLPLVAAFDGGSHSAENFIKDSRAYFKGNAFRGIQDPLVLDVFYLYYYGKIN